MLLPDLIRTTAHHKLRAVPLALASSLQIRKVIHLHQLTCREHYQGLCLDRHHQMNPTCVAEVLDVA